MILGRNAILRAFRDSRWQIFNENGEQEIAHVGPNSVDVTLGHWYIQDGELLSMRSDGFWLYPRELILGVTREAIDCTSPLMLANRWRAFVPMLEGRSTLARMGIVVHLTAGFGDYGFKDAWTLEIINFSDTPYLMQEGMRIAQISFEEVMEPSVYDGSYNNANFKPKRPAKNNL